MTKRIMGKLALAIALTASVTHATESSDASCLGDARDPVCQSWERALAPSPVLTSVAPRAEQSCIVDATDPVCASWARFLSEPAPAPATLVQGDVRRAGQPG